MFILLTLSALYLACKLSHAQDNNNYFLKPPPAGQQLLFVDNDVYNIGDSVAVQWRTEDVQYSIWLWQQSLAVESAVLGQSVFTKIIGGPEQSNFNWTATQQSFDLKQSNVFFFALGPTANITANTTTSHYFNLTENLTVGSKNTSQSSVTLASTISSSTSSTSSTSSSSRTSSTLGTSASQPTSYASSPTPSSDQIPTQGVGEKGESNHLGLAIGLGVAALCIITTGYLAYRYKKKHDLTQYLDKGLPAYSKPDPHPPLHLSPMEISGFSPSVKNIQSFKTWKPEPRNNKPVELAVHRSSTYI